LAKISDEGANSQLLFVLLEWLVIFLIPLYLVLKLNKVMGQLKQTPELATQMVENKNLIYLTFDNHRTSKP
jgi:hypothetical protein